MDMNEISKIPECGFRLCSGSGRLVVGSKQLRKAITKGSARYVFLAENADPDLTDPLRQMCAQKGIRVLWVPTMAQLGRQCGIEVGAAAAAVVDP